MAKKPHQIKVRAYQVDFGDCFLLTFYYKSGRDRHVLIDFGWTDEPEGASDDHFKQVARSIRDECSGKLDAVVVTHRHMDHLRGFDTKKGPGKIIAGCKPTRVIQPWTEHPKARADAKSAPGISMRAVSFVQSLTSMERVAETAVTEAQRLAARALSPGLRGVVEELEYLGKISKYSSKKSPVENLMRMSRKGRGRYIHCGGRSGLERILPAVKVHVLGPPTLEQSCAIRTQTRKHEDYWHLQALTGERAMGGTAKLFPGAATLSDARRPESAGWFVRRLRGLRGEQLLGIVRELDRQMNNTSAILLFEVGKQSLLFTGDAQIENWLYVLNKAGHNSKVRKRLKSVTVFKVGHHGSLNGTPKSVWRLFERRSADATEPNRLRTLLSTEEGHHGKEHRQTEVPRRTLVRALSTRSNLVRTDKHIPPGQLFWSEVLDT